jgi:hypothetical protein
MLKFKTGFLESKASTGPVLNSVALVRKLIIGPSYRRLSAKLVSRGQRNGPLISVF